MESESEDQNPPPENFEENLEENPEGEDDDVVEISNDPVASVSPSASAMKRKLNLHVWDYFVGPDNKQRGTESGGGDEILGNVCEEGWFLGSPNKLFGPCTVSEMSGTECGGGGDETSGNVCEVGWFICGEDQQHIGPYTVSMLCDDFSRGSLTGSTLVCPGGETGGETEWQPLSEVLGVITGISQQVPYDAIGKENVTVSSEVAEPVPDAKRKSPEKPADMKQTSQMESESENQNPPPENFEENLEENPEGEDDDVVEISNASVASVSPSASAMKRKLNLHVWDYFVGPDNKQRGTESSGGDEILGNVCEEGWFLGSPNKLFGPCTVSEMSGETEWQPLSAILGVITGISQQENMADIKMEPDPVGAAVSNLETNGTAATNIADRDAGATLIDRRERESQDAAVSNLETNGTAAANIADIDAGAALTDRERESEEELKTKLERKELEDDEQKLIGEFQHMLSNMYLFANYVLAVSSGVLSLLTKGSQCWMFVTIISLVVLFLIAMVLSLQLTHRQLRALQTKMNSLVDKRNRICPDTKNLELEYESRHCDINLLIFLVGGLMYAGFVLVIGYYLLCSESVNGLSYTPCVPGPHQTVPVESVPDHLLVSPWLPRKFLHQEI